MINKTKQVRYEELKAEHIKDNGLYPDAYALTELIKESIINKDYKIYYGGGYEYNTNNRIDNYDVVVWFNFGGDAFFGVCLNNSEGDSCDLYSSNDKCEILKKVK